MFDYFLASPESRNCNFLVSGVCQEVYGYKGLIQNRRRGDRDITLAKGVHEDDA